MDESQDPGAEKRSSFRAPIDLKVDYKRLNSFFADYTKNISKGGTFIRTERPLPEGTVFRFQMSIPRLSEPLQLTGEVAWIRESGNDPGMGIRFVYSDELQRAEFEGMVEGLMRESLGPVLSKRLLGK